MIPVRIVVQGFLSYRDRAEVVFEGAHTWMLSGRNGAGKSALFDAMTFALFGSGRFDDNEVLPYINDDCSDMLVEFDFDLSHHRYRVKRTASRTKPSSYMVCEINPSTGQPVTGTVLDGANRVKDWLKRELNMDAKTFVAAVLLRQGEAEYLLSMKKDEDRKAVFSRILDLSVYERLGDKVKRMAHDLEQKATHIGQEMDRTRKGAVAEVKESVERFGLDAAQYPTDERWRDSATSLVGRLCDAIEVATSQAQRLKARQQVLIGLKPCLDGWASRLVTRAELRWARAAFSDVLDRAPAIETRAARRDVLSAVLEPLREWAEARDAWRCAVARMSTATERLGSARESLAELEDTLSEAQDAVDDTETRHSDAVSAEATARKVSVDLEARRKALTELENEPTCSVCGLPLTPGHVAEELQNIGGLLVEARKIHKQATAELRDAREAWDAAKAAVHTKKQRIEDAQKNVSKWEREQDLADQERNSQELIANRAARAIKQAGGGFFDRLKTRDDAKFEDCLRDGHYPTEDDLTDLETELASLGDAENERKELESARTQAGKLDAQIANYNEELARDDKAIQGAMGNEDVTAILTERDQAVETAAEQQGLFSTIVAIADHDERSRLAELALDEVRAAAERPSRQTRQEAVSCDTQLRSAESNRDDARDHSRRLDETLVRHSENEEGFSDASREARTMRTLAVKLDRANLQAYLRATAEQAIVANANAILQRLSDGMLELSLEAGTGRPLDLRVTDHEKSAQPKHPAALSGSQRFRVSVALALGIGQYACGLRQGGVKSVIIDEGFGSLDKEGREKMIEELHNLGKVLERVIIVSHQEEFERDFPHRWNICMDGGTAKAELAT